MGDVQRYCDAVQIIKATRLRSQCRTAKSTNAVQSSLYYAVDGCVSANTRVGRWGTGAIEAISEKLQRESPSLRGFSPTNLRNMRIFYEA